MRYQITFEQDPDRNDLQILDDGLTEYTNSIFGEKNYTQIAFFLRNEDGLIVGGVNGSYSTFGWLYVNALWIGEGLRGQGYGNQLMDRIESEAIMHGCSKAFLNTMSYQAPEFYKKRGYFVFAELEDFPLPHSRIFLRKTLV
jgi:N-acetylglutamate synthase-like GNAT family acetyltransferase